MYKPAHTFPLSAQLIVRQFALVPPPRSKSEAVETRCFALAWSACFQLALSEVVFWQRRLSWFGSAVKLFGAHSVCSAVSIVSFVLCFSARLIGHSED